MDINLDGIVLLDEEGKKALKDFSESGIDNIDFDFYLAQVLPTYACVIWGRK